MRKLVLFLVFVFVFVSFLLGFYIDKKNDFFKGDLPDLHSEKEVEFEPIINISSEILGLDILPSDSFEKTIKVWNKKLAIGEYKKNYNIKIYSSDLIKMDYSLDGVSLANTDKAFSKDKKSILFATNGAYKKNETDLPIDVSIYISKEYLFDKSIELSEKNGRINYWIFKGILVNSSDRTQSKILLTETERKSLDELIDSGDLPFEMKLDELYLNENWQGFIKKISELFSFDIIGKVYACGDAPYGNCADHGYWETPYYCVVGGWSCDSYSDCTSGGPCIAGTTKCERIMAWSNTCLDGFACDVCCDCAAATNTPKPPTSTPTKTPTPKPPTSTPTPTCAPSNPNAPILSNPPSGATVNVNTSVNLDWNGISSWGTGCPQDNDYEVCVMSDNDNNCNYVNLTNQGDSTTNYNWTPITGDALVYWKIRAHNGSNTAISSTWTMCVEDQFCSDPQCGETKQCGGVCPTTDDGAPDVSTCSSPSGGTVNSMPISATWTTGGTKTDYYNSSLDNGSAVNVGNVLTVNNISVATTGWHNVRVQSVNNSCGTDASAWSNQCTFCYETEDCSPRCGEDLACSATNCPNDDNGAPGVPTIISPNGTASAPTLYNGTVPRAIALSWEAVPVNTDRYVVGLYRLADNALIWNPSDITSASVTTPSLAAGVYYWRVRAINDTCILNQTSDPSATGYFRINTSPILEPTPTPTLPPSTPTPTLPPSTPTPTLPPSTPTPTLPPSTPTPTPTTMPVDNYLVLKNSDNIPVPYDIDTKNHTCQQIFAESTEPRQIKFVVTATDGDGSSEIKNIEVRINDVTTVDMLGNVDGNWSLASPVTCTTTTTTRTCTFPMNLGNSLNGIMYNLEARATDIWDATSGWVDSGRDLKIWDCQVPTSGTLYKAVDAVQNCPSYGFTVPIDLGVSFDSLIFYNDSNSVTMTVTKPADYGTNDIVWGKTYLPFINNGYPSEENGTLLATGRVTRIIDLGTGTTICPNASQFTIGNSTINPYSPSPRAQIDFSFIRDQEAWYQVLGAGVKGKVGVESGVPGTALQKALTWGVIGVNDNGLVSSNSFLANINGCNDNTCPWGNPNNWFLNQNTNDSVVYNYSYLYNNFYIKAGVGDTKDNSWGGWATNKIYFVSENLDIVDEDLTVPDGETMMVVVNGNINVDPSVKRLDGIYVADGNITVGGTSVDQLNINGMLYAHGDVRLYRGFSDKTDNNANPSVKVNYSPGLIFNLPPEIMRVLSGWREE